jgi:hypothetical protein
VALFEQIEREREGSRSSKEIWGGRRREEREKKKEKKRKK